MSISHAIAPRVFDKETLIKGQPATIRCLEILGQVYALSPGPVRVLTLEDEWYEDVADPEAVIELLREHPELGVDVFSYWQRWPDVEPRYGEPARWERIAMLPLTTYEAWWNGQIKSRVRNQIRKAEKEGLVVREVPFDAAFVRGMTAIFNESPVRQGRPFWHYGKDEARVAREFSRFIHRERMIGAYLGETLVGFIMLGIAGRYGVTGQILSSLRHRDKAPTNALVAKAVQLCVELGLPGLCYLHWSDDSLGEFKRRCGFEPVKVPRYAVPLTLRGRAGLRLGLDGGWRAALPGPAVALGKRLRARWYARTQPEHVTGAG
ncbi:MAG TPA: hypothetical protein VIL35_05430 [Vicinamibacterales bacterium]